MKRYCKFLNKKGEVDKFNIPLFLCKKKLYGNNLIMFDIKSFEESVRNKICGLNIDFNVSNNIKELFNKNGVMKNSFYFENLTDDPFFDISGAKKDFVNFYKKIIKSGVGCVILGGVYLGFNDLKQNNLSRITTEENIISAYKEIVLFAHSLNCKIYLQIKSIYGRFNHLYAINKKFKRGSNFGLDPENKTRVILRLSDEKCNEMINDFCRISMLSTIAGFDGIVIDASYSNVIGELSSIEYNKRIFGYYSNTNDFLSKALKHVDSKNKSIIIKYNFFSFIDESSEEFYLCKINRNIKIKDIINNLLKLVPLGVDGFEFTFGSYANDFLSKFNGYQDELIFEDFYTEFRKELNNKKIKNKFNEDVNLLCHDNINNFDKITSNVKNNIINLIDITRNIYSDNDYLKNLYYKKPNLNCIKCSYCDQKTQFNNKISCLINPNLLRFDELKQISKGEIIAIVGSGISGLICALTLANRGYMIHLYEQKNELNPMGKICTIFGSDQLLDEYYKHIESLIKDLVKRKKIQLFLNQKFKIEDVVITYHSIIIATGFKVKLLSIVGAVQSHVYNIYDTLKNENVFKNKKHIVIYAKSELSLKLANFLANQKGKNITIIIKDVDFLLCNKNANLSYLFYNLYQNNTKIMFLSKIIKINEDNIEVNFCKNIDPKSISSYIKIISNDKINLDRRQQNIDCDLLIYEPDIVPNCDLYAQIISQRFPNEVYLIGNALENSSLAENIQGAYFVGKNL